MPLARYRQISDQLRTQILAGTYKPGDKLPTEFELASRLGVSRVTSAAALRDLARQGLVQRAPRRGTIVAPAAMWTWPRTHAALRPLLAWIQPEIDYAFGLMNGFERASRRAGYNLLLHLTESAQTEEEHAIRSALAAGVAGIALMLQDGETYNAEVLRLVVSGFPIVLVDRHLRGLACATVQSDNVGGARDVVAELVQAGHRHICALVFPPKDTSTIEDRLEGYRQALAEGGIALDLSLIHVVERPRDAQVGCDLPAAVVEHFAGFLRRQPHVTAVFASNARLALLTLRAAERLRLRIPEDLSVVCIDPLESLPLAVPRFTCALQAGAHIGATALELLQEQIAGQPPRRVTVPMQIVRAGTAVQPRPRASWVGEGIRP